MSNYKKIDLNQWERKEHYLYYKEKLKVSYSMTSNIDITKFLDYCHSKNIKFYATFIYCLTKTLNKIENFKMFEDEQGNLCVWDYILPNYTIFHKDDKTFSDCWTDFDEDFETFYREITKDMEFFKDAKGVKVKDNQPMNFYCVSCVPWINFTGYSTNVINGQLKYFPIITIGKYEKNNDKILMPCTITSAHAVCDGYHVGLFFNSLQKNLDEFCETN